MRLALVIDVVMAFLWLNGYADDVDKAIFTIAAVAHAILFLGIHQKSSRLIWLAHNVLAAYIIIAPFIVHSTAGKWLYTAIVLVQVAIFESRGQKCPLTHIEEFGEYVPVLPETDSPNLGRVGQALLLAIMWLKDTPEKTDLKDDNPNSH